MFKSSTPKRRAASRANSQKSTGPRTTQGKAISQFNALKHGIYPVHQIMFDETPEDLAELAAEYHEHYSPADFPERSLVDTMVHNEWRLRRMRRVEAGLWEHARNLFIVKNSGAGPCPAKLVTRNRSQARRAHVRPATLTIQTHFHVLSFDPSKSENPASGSP